MTLREREKLAAADIIAAGGSLSPPGDGAIGNPLRDQWGVYAGSHGGHAKTLKGAMRACLRCCNIGRWWHVGPYDPKTGNAALGPKMEVLFARVSRKHLGGWKKMVYHARNEP